MGFLDHSTNNIIIDAVLTDIGRKKLADNTGAFQIVAFTLADDEVDYSLIEQYGRTVGKEKIVKNTPIFEAQTNSSIALKYRLLTLEDATLNKLPSLSSNLQGTGVALTRGGTAKSVLVEQVIQGNEKVPQGVLDTLFTVSVPSKFCTVEGGTQTNVAASTKIATYSITSTTNNGNLGAVINFSVKPTSLTDTDFVIYGDGNTIKSVISVVGDKSGLRTDLSLTITK